MNSKLVIISLLSLSIYSSAYSMNDQRLTEEQIKQVIDYQNEQAAIAKKKSNNENLARLAGLITTLGAYKLTPTVESFFEKYKDTNPAWTRWNNFDGNPLVLLTTIICFPLLLLHILEEPNKYYYQPKSIQNTIYALKALKGIASLYLGYKSYKFVKNKLEATIPANQ